MPLATLPPAATRSGISRATVEILLDLVEIKLGCVEIHDRDDLREVKTLERARAELCALAGRPVPEARPAAGASRRRIGPALHA